MNSMLRRKLLLVLGAASGAMSLVGCRSTALRYGMPGVIEGERGSSEMDQILAAEIEKLSPKYLDKPLKSIFVKGPDYPAWVRRDHSGNVLIRFRIDTDGKVKQATPRPDDDPELVKLSVDAVTQWRFEPPMAGGRPTVVHMRVPFSFQTE